MNFQHFPCLSKCDINYPASVPALRAIEAFQKGTFGKYSQSHFVTCEALWGYLHWTGRCQVCSLTSGRPGVLTRHSSSAPASPRSGVIRVEVTRRLPSTELCKQRPEVTHCTVRPDSPGSGCGSAAGHFSTMTLCDWVWRPAPVICYYQWLLTFMIVYCCLTSHSSRRDTPTTRGTSVRRIWTEIGGTEIRGLQLIMQMLRKLCSTGSNIKYTSLQLRFVLLFPEV